MSKKIKYIKSNASPYEGEKKFNKISSEKPVVLNALNESVSINENMSKLFESKLFKDTSLNKVFSNNISGRNGGDYSKMHAQNESRDKAVNASPIRKNKQNECLLNKSPKQINLSNLNFNNSINKSYDFNQLPNIRNNNKNQTNRQTNKPTIKTLIPNYQPPPINTQRKREIISQTIIPIRSNSTVPLPVETTKYLVENNKRDRTHHYKRYILLENHSKGFSLLNNEKNQSENLQKEIRHLNKARNSVILDESIIINEKDERFSLKKTKDENLNKMFLL